MIYLFGEKKPGSIFLWITDAKGREQIPDFYDKLRMQMKDQNVALAVCETENWNDDLSPWEAPPVFGTQKFGGRGRNFLEQLLHREVPRILTHFQVTREECAIYLGGYSLAGLFSLFAFLETGMFQGAVSCSGSLWFPGFVKYAKEKEIPAGSKIYLSLGKSEEKTKHPVMSHVGDCTRDMADWLKENGNCKSVLEWNPGNHFTDPEGRMRKGFAWIVQNE